MGALTLLPLDLTGNKLSNRVTGELHNLITVMGKTQRLLVPYFGGFYEDNLMVFNASNVVLTKNVDYKLGCLYDDLTTLTGRAVYGLILIINPAVSAQVRLNYRAVGGQFGLSTEELSSIITQLEEDALPISWDNIINKPKEYPPLEHTHEYWQLYGAEKTVGAMQRVEEAIGNDRTAAYQHDKDYAAAYYQLASSFQSDYRALIIAHRNRTDNPHVTTKSQVGLGNVENLSIATQAEAQAGTRQDRYMTPQLTYYAGVSIGETPINAHIGNTSNPHAVTANQVGAYTKPQTDALVNAKVTKTGTAYSSNQIGGHVFTDLSNSAMKTLSANNFVDLLHDQMLSTTTPSPTSIFYENRWMMPADVFGPLLPAISRWVFIGEIQLSPVNYATVQSVLNATYTNLTQYPYGTIILYIHRYANQRNYGNAVAVMRYVQLEAAIRTASGWIQYN